MSRLKEIARQNLSIFDRGGYEAPSGARVELREAIERAVSGTRVYRPEELAELLEISPDPRPARPPAYEVTAETTGAAARRLLAEGVERLAALNFASAKNAGGGFVSGAKAQEEDLARASALYPCLIGQPGYYEANRRCGSMIYTDHLIYSPDVPFFRDDSWALLERAEPVSIITAPAPNAGEHLRRRPGDVAAVREALDRRAGMVLAAAEDQEHRALLLGAWGCGVFRNDPDDVAGAFGRWLESERFAGAFDRVCFAVYARGARSANRDAFVRRFTA